LTKSIFWFIFALSKRNQLGNWQAKEEDNMLFKIDLFFCLIYTLFLVITLYSFSKWTIAVPEKWMFTNPKNEETGEIVFISMGWGIVCSFCSIVTIILTTVTTIHDARFLIYVISVILIYSFSSLLVRKNKTKQQEEKEGKT